MNIHPRPAEAKVRHLLQSCGLPISDLETARFEHFFGCGDEDDPKGVVGVELYGDVGLLRSLAVDGAARGHGCGTQLVAEAEKHARANGVRMLYLLTTTAERFFASLGYAKVERSSVPDAIRRTQEFSTLCPVSSIVMVKPLR